MDDTPQAQRRERGIDVLQACPSLHALYLDTPVGVITHRWKDDKSRDRGEASVEHICKWQEEG